MTGLDGHLHVNKALSDMLGYSEEELNEKTWMDITHPDDIAQTAAMIQSLKSEETDQVRFEKRHIRSDGAIVWADIQSFLQRNTLGEPQYLISSAVDITERKQAEDSLRESEVHLCRAELLGEFGNWKIDLDTRMVASSEGAESIYGAWGGGLTFDVIHQAPLLEYQSMLKDAWHGLIAENKPYNVEFKIKRDIDETIADIHAIARYDERSNMVFGVVQDVTERKRVEASLKRSQALLSAAEEISKVGGWELDCLTGQGEWTEEVYRIYGIEETDLMSIQDATAFYDKECIPILQEAFRNALEKGEPYDLELKFINARGEHLWVRTIGRPVVIDGQVTKIYGNIVDITERRQTEEALRESEQSLLEAQKLTHIGSWTYDPVTQQPRWSDEMFRIWGLDPELGAPTYAYHMKLIHPDDFQRFDNTVREAVQHGIPYRLELRICRPDGDIRTIITICEPQCDSDGRVVSLRGTCQDITEHKQSEEALCTANDYLQALVHSSALAVIALDLDGKITMWNPAAERIFGWTEEEIMGQPIPSIPDDLRDQYVTNIAKVLQGETLRDVELRRKTKTGDTVFVSASLAPLRGPTNEVIGVISMTGDVTERKKLEYRLRQAQKLEVVGRLSAGLAHEFKNMLMGISGYAEVLQLKFKPDDPNFVTIDDLLACVDNASKLTNQIQRFGKPQAIDPSPIKINQILKELEHMLSRLLGENIQLSVNLVSDDCVINADRSQIEQALVNLAINARDAMPTGGTFTIRTRHRTIREHDIRGRNLVPGEYLKIWISDTGVGMDEETRDQVFEPFFTTKSKGNRTGMGLSVVYSTIKQHKGHIEVSSRPGAGAVFRILLPCIQVEADNLEIPISPPPRHGAGSILLVEDEESVRTPCKMMLEGFGYSVICATNGEEAVEMYRRRTEGFDLVVMDLIMPKLSGKQAWQAMRKVHSNVKVLFMSGHLSDSIHKDLAPPPGTPLLTKPFPLRRLVETVNELLGYGSGSEPAEE